MEFPNVQLYVDGRPQVATKNNPEIIDDWPLHNSHGLNTTMTVGACWQGIEHSGGAIKIIDQRKKTRKSLFFFPTRVSKPDAALYARINGWPVGSDWSNRVGRSDRLLPQVQRESGSSSHGTFAAGHGNPQQQWLVSIQVVPSCSSAQV